MTAAKSLIELPVWMCWAYRGDGPNRTKVPMRVDGEYGSSTDPDSWVDYERAMKSFADHAPDFQGMAFALSYHLAVIDLDHCGDKSTGQIAPWAQDTLDRFATYAEWSPSGTGIHIIMFAKDAPKITGTKFVLPQGQGQRIELYNARHYFTFTADPVPGHDGDVTEQSLAFMALHERVVQAQEKVRNAPQGGRSRARSGPARLSEEPEGPVEAAQHVRGLSGLTDGEVLAAAYASQHGETIQRLYRDGDASDYRNDRSSADMALAQFLSFYTGRDPEQIERIMRSSALARDKWDSKRPGGTYLTFTIDKAVADTTDVYSPGGSDYRLKPPKSHTVKTRAATAEDLPDEAASIQWGVKLDTVTESGIAWLWKDRIPRGMIGMIDGNPGDGKSTIIADIVARVTTGKEWPDGSPSVQGAAIIVGAEDDLRSVWVPRLNAAGANLSQVRQIGLVPDLKTGAMRMPSLPGDVPTFEKLIALDGAVVIVFDPIMPYISAELNSNTDQHVRQALTPLAEVASRHMVTPILLRHYAKNAMVQNAIYRGLGSIGFIGLSRWGYAVAKVGGNTGATGRQFSFMQQKTSIGRPQRAYRYKIRGVERVSAQGEIIETSAIEWGELADDDPDGMLTADGQSTAKKESAEDLIKSMLAEGPVKSEDIYRAVEDTGMSRKTAFRARDNLGIKAGKVGFGEEGIWYWYRPEHEDQMADLRSMRLTKVDTKMDKPVHLSAPKIDNAVADLSTLGDTSSSTQAENGKDGHSSFLSTLATESANHGGETAKGGQKHRLSVEPDNWETCPVCDSGTYSIDETGMRHCDNEECGNTWERGK